MCRYERLLAIVVSLLILVSFAVTAFAQSTTSDEGDAERVLTLQDAIGRIHDSPDLKAAAKGVDVQEGLFEQAGLLPNPDIAVEVENFGGEDELERRHASRRLTCPPAATPELEGSSSGCTVAVEGDAPKADFSRSIHAFPSLGPVASP